MRLKAALPQRRKTSIDDNMTPLINIVFLMLIFFMVAGRIAASDPVNVRPPQSTSATPLEQGQTAIHIDAANKLYIEGSPIALDALASDLERRLNAAADLESFRLIIKGDGSLPAQDLVAVLREARRAGITRIRLATLQANNPAPAPNDARSHAKDLP